MLICNGVFNAKLNNAISTNQFYCYDKNSNQLASSIHYFYQLLLKELSFPYNEVKAFCFIKVK